MHSSNETQTAIDVLKADNERLTGLVSTLTSERDKHKADLAAAKAAGADHESHKKRADELEVKYRGLLHRQEFAKVAKAAGAREEALDDLYTLSGYSPEKDEVDPKAFDAIVTELKASKAYAFEAPAAEGTTRTSAAATNGAPATKPVPGAGRGAAHQPATTGITITKAQLADPKFMLNPANKELIQSAAKEHRILI
jgi:hypothetical protein